MDGLFERDAAGQIDLGGAGIAASCSDEHYPIAALAAIQSGSSGAFQYAYTFNIVGIDGADDIATIGRFIVQAGYRPSCRVYNRQAIQYIEWLAITR